VPQSDDSQQAVNREAIERLSGEVKRLRALLELQALRAAVDPRVLQSLRSTMRGTQRQLPSPGHNEVSGEFDKSSSA
jgi:hypothetical protein